MKRFLRLALPEAKRSKRLLCAASAAVGVWAYKEQRLPTLASSPFGGLEWVRRSIETGWSPIWVAKCEDEWVQEPETRDDENIQDDEDVCLISGNANRHLAMEIAAISELPVLDADIGKYADGEISVQINDNVRGKTVFVIQPVSPTTPGASINDNLIELVLIISCLKRSNAKRIVAVVPYFGYSRHDRIRRAGRETIGAADVAKMLEASGVDFMISVDLHRKQLEGFFDMTPVDSLESSIVSIPYFLERNLWQPTIVCPSSSATTRATRYREHLKQEGVNAKLAFMSDEFEPAKEQKFDVKSLKIDPDVLDPTDRPQHGSYNMKILVGDVAHGDVIIVDDMIDTGRRVASCAALVKEHGAKRIFVWAPHGIFSGNALQRIEDSPVDEILITNTNDLSVLVEWQAEHGSDKVKAMSIAPLLAEAIRRNRVQQSTASLCN